MSNDEQELEKVYRQLLKARDSMGCADNLRSHLLTLMGFGLATLGIALSLGDAGVANFVSLAFAGLLTLLAIGGYCWSLCRRGSYFDAKVEAEVAWEFKRITDMDSKGEPGPESVVGGE